jgi:transposase
LGRTFLERTWAVENATGLGYLLAQQLVGAGERVVDVQPKLAARVRLLATQAVNKNDPHDARSVAIAALRSPVPTEVRAEDHAAVARLWSKRQRDLARARNKVACRLPSGWGRWWPPPWWASPVTSPASPIGIASAFNGTAPIEVSSGGRKIYRLSRRGSRHMNHAIHMAAVTQVRHRHSEGRAYYDRKVGSGYRLAPTTSSLSRSTSRLISANASMYESKQHT